MPTNDQRVDGSGTHAASRSGRASRVPGWRNLVSAVPLLAVLLTANLAEAAPTVAFVNGCTTQVVQSDLVVSAFVASGVAVANVKADVVGVGISIDLVKTGGCYSAIVPLSSSHWGTHDVVVIATDAGGAAGSAAVSVTYDQRPRITVEAPLDGTLVSDGHVRVRVSCTDDDPAGCAKIWAGLVEYPGPGPLDIVVTSWPVYGPTTVGFGGYDTAGHAGNLVTRDLLSAPASELTDLAEMESVCGPILDFDENGILFIDSDAMTIRWRPRSGGAEQIIARDDITRGAITPYGFLYWGVDYGTPPKLVEWRNGQSTTLDATQAMVDGDFALLHNALLGWTASLYDMSTSTIVDLSSTKGQGLGPNGAVSYVDGVGNVFLRKGGQATQLTIDGINDSPTRTDGERVLYMKTGQIVALWEAGQELLLTLGGSSTRHFGLRNGYAVYSDQGELWERTPDGQLLDLGPIPAISDVEAMGPAGEVSVVAPVDRQRYLGGPGVPLKMITGLGRAKWVDGKWQFAIGRHLLELAPGVGPAATCTGCNVGPSNPWYLVSPQSGGLVQAHPNGSLTVLADGRVLLAGGEMYETPARVFRPIWPSVTLGDYHAASLLADGRVLLTGGRDAMGALLANAQTFEPVTETWTPVASMAVARRRHTSTVLADGRVLVAGEGSSEIYDPVLDAWAPSTPMLRSRELHTAVLLPDGRVLVAGGTNVDATTEVFDPVTGTWSFGPDAASPTLQASSVSLPDGRVALCTSALQLFDPSALTLSAPLGSACSGDLFESLVVLSDGRVAALHDGVADVYDLTTGAVESSSFSTITTGAHVVGLGNDLFLIAGGYAQSSVLWAPPLSSAFITDCDPWVPDEGNGAAGGAGGGGGVGGMASSTTTSVGGGGAGGDGGAGGMASSTTTSVGGSGAGGDASGGDGSGANGAGGGSNAVGPDPSGTSLDAGSLCGMARSSDERFLSGLVIAAAAAAMRRSRRRGR